MIDERMKNLLILKTPYLRDKGLGTSHEYTGRLNFWQMLKVVCLAKFLTDNNAAGFDEIKTNCFDADKMTAAILSKSVGLENKWTEKCPPDISHDWRTEYEYGAYGSHDKSLTDQYAKYGDNQSYVVKISPIWFTNYEGYDSFYKERRGKFDSLMHDGKKLLPLQGFLVQANNWNDIEKWENPNLYRFLRPYLVSNGRVTDQKFFDDDALRIQYLFSYNVPGFKDMDLRGRFFEFAKSFRQYFGKDHVSEVSNEDIMAAADFKTFVRNNAMADIFNLIGINSK